MQWILMLLLTLSPDDSPSAIVQTKWLEEPALHADINVNVTLSINRYFMAMANRLLFNLFTLNVHCERQESTAGWQSPLHSTSRQQCCHKSSPLSLSLSRQHRFSRYMTLISESSASRAHAVDSCNGTGHSTLCHRIDSLVKNHGLKVGRGDTIDPLCNSFTTS